MKEKNLLKNKSLFRKAMLINVYFFSVHFLQYLSYIGIVLLILWGIGILVYDIANKNIKKVYLYKFSASFLAIGLISHIINLCTKDGSVFSTIVGMVLLVITAIFMFIFIPNNREKKGRIGKEIYYVGKVYLYSTFVLNIIGIALLLVFKTSLGERIIVYDNRFVGAYINPNMGAFNCFLSIVFGGFLTNTKFCSNIGKKRMNRPFVNIVLALSYFVIAISDSKGALLALVVYLLVFCGFTVYRAVVKRKFCNIRYAALGILMTAVVVLATTPCKMIMSYVVNNASSSVSVSALEENEQKQKSVEDEITFDHMAEKEKNGGGRLELYKKSVELFNEKPLFGWGAGNMLLMGDVTDANTIDNLKLDLGAKLFEAHNGYLTILSTSGIVGFACFAVMLGIMLYAILKNAAFKVKNGGIGKTTIGAAATIAFLVYALVEPSLVYYPTLAVATLWLFLGAGLKTVADNEKHRVGPVIEKLIGFEETEIDD